MRKLFLNEAINIGNQILELAQRNDHGITWETINIDSNSPVEWDGYKIIFKLSWNTNEIIYTGVSGIVLFLLALYRITGKRKYLKACKEGMRWVEWYCDNNVSDDYALISGRMGVSYTFLQLYEATSNKTYLNKALKNAKHCRRFLKTTNVSMSFLTGVAGGLLGLLALHSVSKKLWLLEEINEYVEFIIKNTLHGKVGLCWNDSSERLRPLCGFSHGSAGIGFVFLELGHYFQNPSFYYCAKQAFAYEDYYYNKEIKNWPDFRAVPFREGNINVLKEAYKKNEMKLFSGLPDINAWCHGAAGIGLSRIRGNKILKGKNFNKDIIRALQKNNHANYSHFTLCHGGGGNAELFLEAYTWQFRNKYLNFAQEIAKQALKQKSLLGRYLSGKSATISREDLSLLNGISGVGYFLLRVAYPKKVSSILAPEVKYIYKNKSSLKKYTSISISLGNLKEKLISNLFPNTLSLAKGYIPTKVIDFFEKDSDEIVNSTYKFIDFINENISKLPKSRSSKLKDIFNLELLKMRLDNKKMINSKPEHSSTYLYIKDRINREQSEKLLRMKKNNFLKQFLKIDSNIVFVARKWDLNKMPLEKNKIDIEDKPGHYPLLLKETSYGIQETVLNNFSEKVLMSFKTRKKISNAVSEIVNDFQLNDLKQIKFLENKIVEQIKEGLKYGVFVL